MSPLRRPFVEEYTGAPLWRTRKTTCWPGAAFDDPSAIKGARKARSSSENAGNAVDLPLTSDWSASFLSMTCMPPRLRTMISGTECDRVRGLESKVWNPFEHDRPLRGVFAIVSSMCVPVAHAARAHP